MSNVINLKTNPCKVQFCAETFNCQSSKKSASEEILVCKNWTPIYLPNSIYSETYKKESAVTQNNEESLKYTLPV